MAIGARGGGGSIIFCDYRVAHCCVRRAKFPPAKADVIAIFGAAEYAGRPSPVYRARLDHGYELFQQRMAPMVITTGGAAQDPDFSEGGVGKDYLLRRGMPEQALIAETQGSDTAQSAARVANIMRANGMHSCIAVSDAYHVFRIRALLEHEGVQVELAPRPESRPRHLCGAFYSCDARGRKLFSVESGRAVDGRMPGLSSAVRSWRSRYHFHLSRKVVTCAT